MSVNLIDNEKIIASNTENIDLVKDFNDIFKCVCKDLKQPYKKLSLNIEYVSSETIKAINNKTRKIDEVTDVLSFPYINCALNSKIKIADYKFEFDKLTKSLLIGDIIICIDKASSQALDFGHSLRRELCYLVTHGILHCFGFDHEEDKDKKIMRAAEEFVLTKLKITR